MENEMDLNRPVAGADCARPVVVICIVPLHSPILADSRTNRRDTRIHGYHGYHKIQQRYSLLAVGACAVRPRTATVAFPLRPPSFRGAARAPTPSARLRRAYRRRRADGLCGFDGG